MKDYLEHYETVIDAFHQVASQNKMLFEFIAENGYIEEWNAFYQSTYEE